MRLTSIQQLSSRRALAGALCLLAVLPARAQARALHDRCFDFGAITPQGGNPPVEHGAVAGASK